MKLLLKLALSLMLLAPVANAATPIVPLPVTMEVNENSRFRIDRKLTASINAGDSVKHIADGLFKLLPSGVTVKKKGGDITFATDYKLGPEAYSLDITKNKIAVKASRPAGFFYAVQTLRQLIEASDGKSIPAMKVTDEPRFGWRGFMLDEGRHIFGKDEVKRVLDLMAMYKLNRFHWHLTEDQGWRIEIKKYPKLTDVGAWRDSEVLGWWGHIEPDTLDKPYGGFYTQDDVREIVDYARDRFIEIIPEIDIPGHTQAAVAAYPEILACDPENPHSVWLWQGVSPDVMNVANPAAVQMSKDIIDELIPLFPFGYLHLGGDECPTTKWETNALCNERLKQIGSTKHRDLQLDYYRQLQEHINAKPANERRKLVFWNEVLHGNTSMLDPDITIMAWVGADKAALDAAKRGLTTILTPQIPYYINRKQSTAADEPHSQGQGNETVEAVYSYVPMKDVPENLQDKYMGVQANFWSEYVPTAEFLEYLMLPRLAAVAEAAWTPQDLRNYNDFKSRIQLHEQIGRAHV